MTALAKIGIILVGPTHPGNIGAAARAMKAMGLVRLALVNPKRFPCAEATAMASGADDILAKAKVCRTLAEALRGYGLVVGTTARERSIAWPLMDPRECVAHIMDSTLRGDVAIVFGREHSGLTNQEIELCNFLVRVPTVLEFSSLNLAAAVQVIAYEVRQAALRRAPAPSRPAQTLAATGEQMEMLYAHLEQVMIDVGFYDRAKPRRLMRRIRRLFNRAEMDENEVQILRGFLAAVQSAVVKD